MVVSKGDGYMKYKTALTTAALGGFALLILRYSQQSAQAVREGLLLCGNVLIPALFPFLVLASLVVELGLADRLGALARGWMRPLFGVGGAGASALALGLVGGYPVGAKTVCQLYSRGRCSRAEAQRLLAFCCNCGPGFILGVVGDSIFGSRRIGLLLWAAHVAAALMVGLLFRLFGDKEITIPSHSQTASTQPPSCAAAFLHAVTGSLQSCLNISAFVLFFSVLNRLLALSGLVASGSWLGRFLAGFLELSTGVSGLTEGNTLVRLGLAAFFLGWGGLSVHGQTYVFLSECGLSPKPYLAGKLLHGLLSALLVLPLSRALAVPTLLPQMRPCLPGFVPVFSRSLGLSMLLWLLCSLAMVRLVKNCSGKSH